MDSSAERITGRAEVRKSGENANAGRLERKGKPDRTESPCKWRLFVFVFNAGENAFKGHPPVNLPKIGVRV